MRSQARERREAGGGAGRKSPDAAEPGPGSCGREFTDQKKCCFWLQKLLVFFCGRAGDAAGFEFQAKIKSSSVLVSFDARILPEIKSGDSPPKGDNILSFISSKNNPNRFP